MICRRNVLMDPVGSICPNCGHNTVFHPGANYIEACILCELEAVKG